MANTEDEQGAQRSENELDLSKSDLSSEDGDSGDEDESSPVEWLATGRERRSTAGNRMKSMIAAEEPDDDLELLFAEDEDDAGFTDVEDEGSDVQMDSSSDDEDAQENADELEGEKELEKQARESRQATRKRKAQEAIPIKFRKKVKIAPTPSGSSTAPEPKPRPKKKSERTSWLPSPADMPTRASKRETTMLSKEQLHQQMIEREVKRLKQVEAMEKKAKKMEALKKPPMTQAQRLAEAAIVEKKNAKSLNRWEEAEKQREEERRAKLAALNNRTLDGPVVTFWSGVGEWVDGKLKHVGKIVTIEEKPAKKKRASAAGHEIATEPQNTQEASKPGEPTRTTTDKVETEESGSASTEAPKSKEGETTNGAPSVPEAPKDTVVENEKSMPTTGTVTSSVQSTQAVAPSAPSAVSSSAPKDAVPPAPVPSLSQPQHQIQELKPPETKPPDMKPPDMRPPAAGMYTTSMFAPPQPSHLMKPPELKPPSNSFLAPPAGVTQGGLSMPMIGYHSATPNPSNPSTVLAPPNTAQRQSPLSMPQTGTRPPPMSATHPIPSLAQPVQISMPKPTPAAAPATAPLPISSHTPKPTPKPISIPPAPTQTSAPAPAQKSSSNARHASKPPLHTAKSSKVNAQRHQRKETPPPPPPSPPANGKATRNCIILQNFNENAVKEKAIQNQILFGKDMAKLSKPAPAPRCVITNHPARYKDPTTGLPYYNAYAFREIQKLWHGEYKWSTLVGAWMGNVSHAADGVPARFLDPKAPGPPKKTDPPENPSEGAPEPKDASLSTPDAPKEQKEPVAATDIPTVSPATTSTSNTSNSTLSDPPASVAPPTETLTTPSTVVKPTLPTEPLVTPTPAAVAAPAAAVVTPAVTMEVNTNTGT
ncbi:YL1-domain-containing protein [Hypomontagnella monticulosa]|nr:YL1-domain-containing protein [Hypomontagnella monticulosa]